MQVYLSFRRSRIRPKVAKGKLLQSPTRLQKARDAHSNPLSKGCRRTTRYHFEITVNGKNDPAWAGSFKTAPVSGKPAAFRLALTSCMKIGQPQAFLVSLCSPSSPIIHLTVGDTHYADTTDPTVQWKHHVTYRRQKEFATVLRNVPTLRHLGRPRLRSQ